MSNNTKPEDGRATPQEEWPATNMLEAAWGLIANSYGGDWDQASDEWKRAAERWRDAYTA